MDATYRIQANSGTVTSAGFTATLPNPTTDGSALMLWLATTGASVPNFPAVDPPWFKDLSAAASVFSVWRRAHQPGGETSWTVTAAVSGNYAWRIEEWSNWSTINQPDAVPPSNTYNINTGVQFNLTVVSGSSITPDVADFAGLAVWRAGSGSAIWPLRTYSSGWSEVDRLAFGTGASLGDYELIFAESYPGVSGAIDAEMIWDTSNGGTYAEKTVYGWAGCYGAAVSYPAGVVLSTPPPP